MEKKQSREEHSSISLRKKTTTKRRGRKGRKEKNKGIIHAKSLKQEQACHVLRLGVCSLENKGRK